MNRKEYTLAASFVDDHWARDCGETDVEVKRSGSRVTVSLDAEGYRDMLSDADYYADLAGSGFIEPEYRGIVRSATRVLAVLEREGPPSADPTPGEIRDAAIWLDAFGSVSSVEFAPWGLDSITMDAARAMIARAETEGAGK